jgi:phenylacetate-CoA ligase
VPLRDVVRPRILITNAEVFDPQIRSRVQAELDSELFNFYGACEFGRIAWECKAHEGLHVNADHLIVECLDDGNNPVPFKQTGTIVVTSLYSLAMPFIRYNLNDLGMLKEAKCSCGSPLPLMAAPMGRDTEVLKLPSGRIMPPLELLNLMSSFSLVDQFRLVQETTDLLRVELVMRADRDPATEETIKARIKGYLNEPVRVEVVTKKSLTVSGSKLRIIVSNVDSVRPAS